MTLRLAARLGAGLGILLGTLGALGIYQFAEWLAVRWNPFA